MAPTVAALVIGNEILTGKVQETNVALLARELFRLGARFRRVVVCPDDIETIAADLEQLRRQHDFVVTSGGVGPTHDDVTIKAVARCFGRPVVRSPQLEQHIRKLVGERLNQGHLRMADVPEGADLLFTEEVPWPTILVDNVFVMPGLPRIFEMKLPLLGEHIAARRPFVSRVIYTLCRETDLAELLDRIDAEHADVEIGSYPVLDEKYRVRLTFDGKDADAVESAAQAVLAALPADCIVDL